MARCDNAAPRWFAGHWRDWHRGHGCDKDDGLPPTPGGAREIAEHVSCSCHDAVHLRPATIAKIKAVAELMGLSVEAIAERAINDGLPTIELEDLLSPPARGPLP